MCCSSIVPGMGFSSVIKILLARGIPMRICEHTILLTPSPSTLDPLARGVLAHRTLTPSLHAPGVSSSLRVWETYSVLAGPEPPAPSPRPASCGHLVPLLVYALERAAGALQTSTTLQVLRQQCHLTPLQPSAKIWALRGSPGSLGQSVCFC